MPPFKADPMTVEFESKAKNILKAELRRQGLTYADLADKLSAMGVPHTEHNLNNKIARGGFSAAFFLQAMTAIGVTDLRL